MESVAGRFGFGVSWSLLHTRLTGDLPYLGPSIHILPGMPSQNSSPSSETGLCLHTSRQLNSRAPLPTGVLIWTQGQIEGWMAVRRSRQRHAVQTAVFSCLPGLSPQPRRASAPGIQVRMPSTHKGLYPVLCRELPVSRELRQSRETQISLSQNLCQEVLSWFVFFHTDTAISSLRLPTLRATSLISR